MLESKSYHYLYFYHLFQTSLLEYLKSGWHAIEKRQWHKEIFDSNFIFTQLYFYLYEMWLFLMKSISEYFFSSISVKCK